MTFEIFLDIKNCKAVKGDKMGCSCGSTPRAFQIKVKDKDRLVFRLDQVVLSTIVSLPNTEEDAAEQLWYGVQMYNDFPEEEKESFQKVLLEIYRINKKAYEN